MTGHHLEVLPLSKQRWIVRYEGDPTPLSESPTLADALADARLHARQFGEPVIHVQGLDGNRQLAHVDPDFRAPTAADVKGPHVEP